MSFKQINGSAVMAGVCFFGYFMLFTLQEGAMSQNYLVTFYRYRDVNVGPSSLYVNWIETSDVSCALTIRKRYPLSRGFVFNKQTLQCSSGLSINTSSRPESSFLYSKVNCDETKGFKILANGTSVACIGFFNHSVNYSTADIACGSKSAFLMSVKTVDKLNMLRQVVNVGTVSWVGLDDIVKDGTYIWKEDNSTLTKEERTLLFQTVEIKTPSGKKANCMLYVSGAKDGLTDTFCSDPWPYVCEIAL